MIFVTVGTQVSFDRLIGHVDEWLLNQPDKVEIVAQIGNSNFNPKRLNHFKSEVPILFEEYIDKCELLVSHAGMGSIMTALRKKKPIIIFPRKASLGEHRNDHQLSTIKYFSDVDGVYVANTKDDLFKLLNSRDLLSSGTLKESDEYKNLLNNLVDIIEGHDL